MKFFDASLCATDDLYSSNLSVVEVIYGFFHQAVTYLKRFTVRSRDCEWKCPSSSCDSFEMIIFQSPIDEIR